MSAQLLNLPMNMLHQEIPVGWQFQTEQQVSLLLSELITLVDSVSVDYKRRLKHWIQKQNTNKTTKKTPEQQKKPPKQNNQIAKDLSSLFQWGL